MSSFLADLARSLSATEVVLRGRSVAVRLVTGNEHAAIVRAIPAPVAPQRPIPGREGVSVPNRADPDYVAAVDARDWLLTAAIAGVAMDLSRADGSSFDPRRPAPDLGAWLRGLVEEIGAVLSVAEVRRVYDAQAALSAPEPGAALGNSSAATPTTSPEPASPSGSPPVTRSAPPTSS